MNFAEILQTGGVRVTLSITFSFLERIRPGTAVFSLARRIAAIVLLGAFAGCAGVAGFAHAQSRGEQALVRRFEARYRGTRSLQANFLERYSERGKILRLDAGVAYFRRPGKMCWNYESPEKNVFVVDGKTAWFYVPADRTVTKMKAKESGDWRTPLSLLAGEMKVSRVCSRVDLAARDPSTAPGHAVLHCRIRGAEKDSAEAPSASFEIVESTGDLVRVVVAGPGGTELEFQFSAWRINPPLEDALFRFEAPRGTAIVNGDSVAGDDGRNHPQP